MTDNQENNRPLDEENSPAMEEEIKTEGEAEAESPYVTMKIIQIGVLPGFILRKVGQAYMVMPTGPRMKEYQGMITLNETGAFLFKESQKPDPTKETLIEACKTEYGATDEEALEAVDAFILQCAECGLFASKTGYFDKKTGKEVPEDALKE